MPCDAGVPPSSHPLPPGRQSDLRLRSFGTSMEKLKLDPPSYRRNTSNSQSRAINHPTRALRTKLRIFPSSAVALKSGAVMSAALPTRKIGPLAVSAIGLGCMNLSHAYLPRPDPAQAERLLLHALDAGVTFFDTASIYGSGANEELLGRTLMSRRSEFILASKCV